MKTTRASEEVRRASRVKRKPITDFALCIEITATRVPMPGPYVSLTLVILMPRK